MVKPLPAAILKPSQPKSLSPRTGSAGVVLGDNVIWNPVNLPNGHVVLIGGSGSGKTQSLKALAHELPRVFPALQIITVDFHGDLELPSKPATP